MIDINERFEECPTCGVFLIVGDDCINCDDERPQKKPTEMVKFDSKRRKPKYVNTAKKKRGRDETWNQ